MGYEINETIEEDFESAESVGDLDKIGRAHV